MNTTDFTYISGDLATIYATKWASDNGSEPKAVIQLAHGMAEHIGRYHEFAQELVQAGFVVYGNDHRGHGRTGDATKSIGFFAEEDGFDTVVSDMKALTMLIKDEYKDIPIILFGHSMGSFLARRYIQLYGTEIDGLILSGTGGNPGLLGKIGKLIAKGEMKRSGNRAPSQRMNMLTFGSYNRAFKPARTEYDWLSSVEEEVDKYIADPYCGGVFSTGFFYDLLSGLQLIYSDNENRELPLDVPILFLGGEKDPVGANGKGVVDSYTYYKKLGFKSVMYKLYSNSRHEILNEANREMVYKDIIDWIEMVLYQRDNH